MVAIGDGAKAMVEQSFAAMGSNLLIIMSGTTTSGGAHGGFGSQPTLTWDDLAAIQREVTSVEVRGAAAALERAGDQRRAELDHQRDRHDARLLPDPQLAGGVGRARLGASDVEGATKIVVLGQTVVDKLLRPQRRPGRPERAHQQRPLPGRRRARAQGAVGRAARTTTTACSSRRRRFRPRSRAASSSTCRAMILASATGADATARAERQITALLRERHHLRKGTDDDFSIRNLSELASAQQEGTQHADHAAGEHRGGVAAGRRRRHHEHHAGQRDRADARDRPAHGGRRAALRHPVPSSWSRR